MKLQKFVLRTFFFASLSLSSFAANKAVVIDVRTPEEYQTSHLKDSVNIDFKKPDFKDKIAQLDKNQSYKLYCRSGNRSGKAMELMKAQGFKDVENMGSLHDASERLKQACEGPGRC